MKIIKCHIENFGKLCNADYTFDVALTEFCEGNGFGKTTLAAFIKAMFFGLPTVRANAKEFNDRKHFYPFSGGKFGGSLTFESGGDIYRIERFFGKKSDTDDELTVYCNNKIFQGFGNDIGKAVFGVDRESFERTVFITSEALDYGVTGGMCAKLNCFVENTDGDEAFGRVIKELKGAKKALKADKGNGGLISRTNADIAEKQSEIRNLESIARSLDESYSKKNALEQKIAQDGARLEEIKNADVISERRHMRDEMANSLAQKQSELDSLPGRYPLGLTADAGNDVAVPAVAPKKNGTLPIVLAVLFAVVAVAGIALIFVSLAIGVALAVAGGIGAGICTVLWKVKASAQSADIADRAEAEATVQKQRIEDGVREVLAARLTSEINGLKKQIAEYEQKYGLTDSPETVYGDASSLTESLNADRKLLAELDSRISADESEIENLDDRKSELEALEEKIKEYKRRYQVLCKTQEMLEKADGNLKDKYVKPVKDIFLKYAKVIEGALGERIIIDRDFDISFEHSGETYSEKHFSSGLRSICALCMRLAFIENMYGSEKPFIIMDDPFVFLDEKHIKNTINVVKQLAKDNQIIYFCCHNSRMAN